MAFGTFGRAFATAAFIALAGNAGAAAQTSVTAAPAVRNDAYPGTITLAVDATDVTRGIFRVKETIPAQQGPLTLLYPEWLPGNHAPRGPIDKVAGLVITAGGKTLPWRRDPLNVFAYHVDVPAGATAVEANFQFVSPVTTAQGRIVTTPVMLNLQWNQVALYPAGYDAGRIPFAASVTLPEGWKHASGLDVKSSEGATTTFETIDFASLVDSPMFAGQFYREFDLDPGARAPFRLAVVADREDQLAATDEQIALHRALVKQTYKVFGPGRYSHYTQLLALSETLGGIGLEHLRSNEIRREGSYFTEWKDSAVGRDVFAHELAHSWNGKWRRPAGLATPNFDEPMQNYLLWVYEGQTQYWGYVLSARSGLMTKEQTIEALALTAATYDNRKGRSWRSLDDTVHEPIISARRPEPWRNWQRPEDYYSEGQLIWLDADTLIRERTGGRKSLDDFAKIFFRAPETGLSISPYDFDEVVAALNAVTPYDWAAFLRKRVDEAGNPAPLDGLARGGWKLVYAETRTDWQKAAEKRAKNADFMYSIGFIVGEDKKLTEVMWDGPAFNAGLTTNTELLAVNGVAYDAEGLRRAITSAKADGKPIELLIKNGDRFRTVSIPYTGGLRYPRLERIAGTPDRLSQILAPRR